MSDTQTPLPSIADHIDWLTETLTSGFKPGQPVDDAFFDMMVEHLNTFRRFAELVDAELTICRQLQDEIEKRRHVSAASLHPQPEKMQ